MVFYRPDITALPDRQKDKIKKGLKYDTQCYLLDSSNLVHLDKLPEGLVDVVLDRVKEKIMLGLKAPEKFLIEMTIQSLFDQRAFFARFLHILNTPHYALGQIERQQPERLAFIPVSDLTLV